MSILARRPQQFNQYGTNVTTTYGNASMLSAAGERIDEYSALGVSAVLAAVSLLADSVAAMPLRCYSTQGAQRVSVDLPEALAKPSPEMSTFELVHQAVASMSLHGNAYINIVRDSFGDPVELIPLHPYQMQVLPNKDMTARRYLHLGNEIPNEDMIHLRWFTPPQSLVGVSPILQQRTIIGLSIAMDRHLAQWYGDGGTPSSVLETDSKLSPDAAEILRNTWEDTHRRRRRPAVLTDGLKWRPISASAADMEMNATRLAVIGDVARIFRIPPHLLGVKGDGQTYANVEQASLNFWVHTLSPLARRIEVALSRVAPADVNVNFDTSVLLRVDAMQRYRIHQLAIGSGIKSPNEVRLEEGLNPYDGGDSFVLALPGAPMAGGMTPVLGENPEPDMPIAGVQD